MICHDVSSIWPQNIIQSIGPFNQSITSLNQPSNWYFSPIDCLVVQAIATFQASDFQSQVYPTNCPCVLADITKQLPRLPIDCLADPIEYLAFPTDCSLCAVTNRLLCLEQLIACWQIFILKFS